MGVIPATVGNRGHSSKAAKPRLAAHHDAERHVKLRSSTDFDCSAGSPKGHLHEGCGHLSACFADMFITLLRAIENPHLPDLRGNGSSTEDMLEKFRPAVQQPISVELVAGASVGGQLHLRALHEAPALFWGPHV